VTFTDRGGDTHQAKGSYYALAGRSPFSHLVYPLPESGGLGVHLTLDLAGRARFGPDVEWLPDPLPGQPIGALGWSTAERAPPVSHRYQRNVLAFGESLAADCRLPVTTCARICR
jgi:hypothetical protein